MSKTNIKKNKKVTFLISSLAGGGAEGVCVNIANGLAERGWKIDLVVLNLKNATYLDRISDKVNLISLNVNHTRYSGLSLLKYIRKEQPKTILVFDYVLAVMIIILRTIFRFKSKIIARNINTFSQNRKENHGVWQKYVVNPLISKFYCNVDHIINQCQAMREDLITVYPQMAERSSVIYNPVAKYIENYANSHNLTHIEKKDYFLCVGRLEKQKAFHYAIEAFALFIQKQPKNQSRLKIVGQGSLEQDLKQCAVDLGIAERIDFEGFQKNILPYYLYAKATILTSLYEGFPNVLVESLTLGTPVIAFDCSSGPNEIIQDGVNGYLIEYLNIEKLAHGLKKLSLATHMHNNKKIIKSAKQYTNDCIIQKYEDFLS